MLDIQIKEHPSSTIDYPLWLVIITNKTGNCYYCTFAGEKPTESRVIDDWKNNRKVFDKYYSGV